MRKFVGPTGSGRRTATRAKLQEVSGKAERPADWAYVSSFDPTGGFRALKLSPGTAKPFAEKMALAIEQPRVGHDTEKDDCEHEHRGHRRNRGDSFHHEGRRLRPEPGRSAV